MLGSGGLRLLLTHSDDNLCVGLGDASKKELMEAWSADFDQSPDSAGVDNLHEFLGLRVDRKDDHMLISAPGIIAKLPAMVGSCPSSCSSPLSVTHGCDDPVDPVKNPPYEGKIDLRQPLGVCLFVALSCRPDVAHAAIWLSSYVGRKILTKNVARQVNRLAWYLVTTLETHVLCFRKSDGVLRALMDASLANDASLKSWYGFSTTLGVNTGVIAFRSALARSIVASTRDSELLACLHCTYRVFALRLFLAEIGLQQVAPTPMGSDAMAVIQGVSVKTVHRDSRWSAIRFAVIKQAMEVHVLYVSNRFTTSITFAGGRRAPPVYGHRVFFFVYSHTSRTMALRVPVSIRFDVTAAMSFRVGYRACPLHVLYVSDRFDGLYNC